MERYFFLLVDISVELFPVILLLLPVLIGPAVSVDSRFSPGQFIFAAVSSDDFMFYEFVRTNMYFIIRKPVFNRRH